MSYLYPLKYNMERGQFTKEEVQKEGAGCTDSLLIVSVMGEFGNGEALTTMLMTADGRRGGPLKGDDIFGIWCHIANTLSQDSSLPMQKRALASHVFDFQRLAALDKMRK